MLTLTVTEPNVHYVTASGPSQNCFLLIFLIMVLFSEKIGQGWGEGAQNSKTEHIVYFIQEGDQYRLNVNLLSPIGHCT